MTTDRKTGTVVFWDAMRAVVEKGPYVRRYTATYGEPPKIPCRARGRIFTTILKLLVDDCRLVRLRETPEYIAYAIVEEQMAELGVRYQSKMRDAIIWYKKTRHLKTVHSAPLAKRLTEYHSKMEAYLIGREFSASLKHALFSQYAPKGDKHLILEMKPGVFYLPYKTSLRHLAGIVHEINNEQRQRILFTALNTPMTVSNQREVNRAVDLTVSTTALKETANILGMVGATPEGHRIHSQFRRARRERYVDTVHIANHYTGHSGWAPSAKIEGILAKYKEAVTLMEDA